MHSCSWQMTLSALESVSGGAGQVWAQNPPVCEGVAANKPQPGATSTFHVTMATAAPPCLHPSTSTSHTPAALQPAERGHTPVCASPSSSLLVPPRGSFELSESELLCEAFSQSYADADNEASCYTQHALCACELQRGALQRL